ncbi:hypothetical protein JOE59_003359 [Agromyces cerinus]|uniref:hypothetical protein n=1 Tax=Agromyces cerinus TaxID=33878 RepID=UPI001956E25F|nr:hypothetical protein [Agromyces cerinus]MBM7832654.1 hypothetical protein [Agromyces cerinus]
MNTTKTGSAAIGAVALLVVLSACAGVRDDVEPGNVPQSQHELQQSARQESDAMRAELHAGATSVQSFATAEGIRSAKQAESRSFAGPSPSSVEGIRSAKQAESRSFAGPSPSSVEGIRSAKQSEARADVGPSAAEAQGVRLTKYGEALAAAESLRQHELEHGASSDRLR